MKRFHLLQMAIGFSRDYCHIRKDSNFPESKITNQFKSLHFGQLSAIHILVFISTNTSSYTNHAVS